MGDIGRKHCAPSSITPDVLQAFEVERDIVKQWPNHIVREAVVVLLSHIYMKERVT